MANILLVSESKSFISLSLVNHLKNCGHQVFQIGTDLDDTFIISIIISSLSLKYIIDLRYL